MPWPQQLLHASDSNRVQSWPHHTNNLDIALLIAFAIEHFDFWLQETPTMSAELGLAVIAAIDTCLK
jgi:hypothetical protein